MSDYDPFTSRREMHRCHRSFQIWQRVVFGIIIVSLALFGYIGYKLLMHLGVL